jgi:mannose-1-phosphate guanylyltransferase / phosphomannomutase
MKAIIMAGGFGTRLRPLTIDVPKPMASMVNKPMMHRIVDLLKSHKITDLIILLYFQPDIIKKYFGDGSRFGVKIEYIQADADYGTAGAVRLAANMVKERFLVISGDVLTDFDLTKALDYHVEKNAMASIVLTHSKNPLQYGVVITDENGKISQFLEKPSWGEVFSDKINTGIYLFENAVLDHIPFKQEFDFSKNLFPHLLKDDLGLYGYVADGYWRDVGNLNEYQEAHQDCLNGNVKINFEGNKKNNLYLGSNSKVLSGFIPEGTVVIGDNCLISDNVKIINSVIGNDCSIYSGAVIKNSVLWDHVQVGMEAELSNDVVGNDTIIGQGAVISDNVFIGPRCMIGNRSKLMANIKLWPEKIVEDGAILSTSLVWEDKWLKELFSEARISGISNIEINPEFASRLGSAFGAFVRLGNTVVASRDPDDTSRMIKRALTSGLMSAGVSTRDLQVTPIPIVRHELSSGKQTAGFHVRKSPYYKNITDIIFFDANGKDLSINKVKSIEKLFFGEDYGRAPYDKIGSITFPERAIETYRERFIESLNIDAITGKNFKIVIDYCNGVTSTIFPMILGSFNAQVISLNAYLDRKKLTRSEEEFNESKKEVANIITSLKYDVGFVIDAGSEKIFLVDDKGNSISNDRLVSIVTKLFLETNPKAKTIAVPITCSSEIELIAKQYDVQVIKTKNSHYSMMQTLENPDVAFVGGTRGGFIFPEFIFAVDGMYSIAKILEMLAVSNLNLSYLEEITPKRHLLNSTVFCSWESKGKIMRTLIEESAHNKRELVDGVKIFFDDNSWVLLIPDKERPVFHIRVESDVEERAKEIMVEYLIKFKTWH